MTKYKIRIETDALLDIQNATDWYDLQLPKLGSRFQKQVKTQLNSLKNNPSRFAIRYADVRCMPIKRFPFLAHYTVDTPQTLVNVLAVVHTSRNPEIWKANPKS